MTPRQAAPALLCAASRDPATPAAVLFGPEDRGLSNAAVGVVLASLLAGTALLSVLIARHGDRVGRRRCYRLLFVGMAIAGTVFALTGSAPRLVT